MTLAQLHWIIADKNEAITVESIKDGIKIYDNPVGVLTNNPPFDKQMFNLNNYMNLSPKSPKNNFSDKLNLNMYSRGMGAIGLPGDLSSQSRFVRAAFVKTNSLSGETESESVSQFFIFLVRLNSKKAVAKLQTVRSNTLFTLLVATVTREYIITPLMKIIKLQVLI